MMKLFIVFLALSATGLTQELNCRVEVNFESLPVNNRELLADFSNVIESYMNTTRFTEIDWAEKIDCSLTILFSSASGDVDYTAQIIVVSQRPVYNSTSNSLILTINDAAWSFRYERGQALYSGQSTFDGLTSFLEFYAMIIIGFDWDTWEEFGGNRYFQRAQDIVNLGATSGFSNGWLSSSSSYNRWGLTNDLLAEKYSKFRSTVFDYHYGIDIYQQDKNLGHQKIVSLIDNLYNMWETEGGLKSVLLTTFFDAKHGEMIELLRDYEDTSIFEKLKKIDPQNSTKYEAAIP
ncbi:MAG: DUF4835 family protein [Ignavibacteria bacterium]|nr:DUF4835 family protein [Ignavibacteria bacterium]